MILWSSVVCILILIVCLVWYSTVSVSVDFARVYGDDEGCIRIRCLFGLIRYKKLLTKVETEITPTGPLLHLEHQTSVGPKDRGHKQISPSDVWGIMSHLREWSHKLQRIRPGVRRLLARVHVSQLEISASIGVGDAMGTGMAVGALWALTSTVLGGASHRFQLDQMPLVMIQPNFQQTVFNLRIHGIARVRAGYAISAAIGIVRVWKGRTLNGASNSRSHADSHG